MGYGDVIMERNRKCNIAGILFTLLLIYETYSYVMFLKVLSEFDVETVWTRLYFCSYADGSEWVMIIGKLFAICSLITFLDKFNADQFRISGCADANVLPDGWRGASKEFVELYYKQGNTGQYKEGNRLACYIDKNGKAKAPYKRILIQKKV